MWLSYCFLLFLLSFPCHSCRGHMTLSCSGPALSLLVLIFYGKCHGLIGLCPTFAPSWARGFAYCYFLLGWPVGPYFFIFFVLGFYIPLFLPLLTNFLLHSFFTCYWAFSTVGHFFISKKGINKGEGGHS